MLMVVMFALGLIAFFLLGIMTIFLEKNIGGSNALDSIYSVNFVFYLLGLRDY